MCRVFWVVFFMVFVWFEIRFWIVVFIWLVLIEFDYVIGLGGGFSFRRWRRWW